MHRSSKSQAPLRLGILFSAIIFVILLLTIFTYKPTPASIAPAATLSATSAAGNTSTPVPNQTAMATQTPPLVNAAQPPSPEVSKAVIADWEEMFQATNNYENVSANGRPGDQAWWTEQANRFYTGSALVSQLQYIESMFHPPSAVGVSPGFIQEARYTPQVVSCSSASECTLQVSMQSGTFWVYDIRHNRWTSANPIEPSIWTVQMQYDPASGHWKVQG